ncbi:MAG: peptidoglycan-binding domain-containing protein [Nannocystaceae bacterium]
MPRLQTSLLRASMELVEVARGFAVLSRGSRGDAVEALQRGLQGVNLLEGAVDGIYGPATAAAVRKLQRVHGLAELGTVDAITLLALDRGLILADTEAPAERRRGSLLLILHTAACHSAAYRDAIANWPDEAPLWEALTTQLAREELIRYVAQVDDTPRGAGAPTLAAGLAVELFARYSSRAALDPGSRGNLRKLGVDPTPVPAKLRLPLLLAMGPDHALCAFLVDEGAPQEFASYRLFDPQTDAFFTRADATRRRQLERFGLSVAELAGCDDRGRFDLQPVADFIVDGRGVLRTASSPAVARFIRDFSIAESSSANYDFYVGGAGGFVSFIRRQAREIWRLNDDALIEVGRLVIGREFRSHPQRRFKAMSAERYVALLGRLDLLRCFPATPREDQLFDL